jgi:sugar phosphate isomerase/epimerase
MALPPHPPARFPVGLCVFGIAYASGLSWSGAPEPNPDALTPAQIVDLTADSGLSWVEMPTRMLVGSAPEALDALHAHAEERGVRFVVAGSRVRAAELIEGLRVATKIGAPVVRCVLSSILCGDRRGFEGGWRAHLDATERELEQIVPEAERLRVAVAIENHQDADSEDLLRLCRRFESRYLGVTLDTGNPLAVMEEPLEFARRIAPYLRHAHLKDYRVYPAPNGFRLARCAMGAGVIDFPALFELFDAQEWPVTRNIEMGALRARQIPMLESSWWDEFSPRAAQHTLGALSLVMNRMEPAGSDWRTPFERDAPAEELKAYEWAELRDSLDYLKRILPCRS